MKNCEYCDYFKKGENSGESDGTALCLFTNVLFFMDFDKSQAEYLCKDMTYPQYLASQQNRQLPSRIGREDWKLLYKSRHPVAENLRTKSAV